MDRRQHLMALRGTVIEYLLAKAKEEDWHGVSDAANDLREIDAEVKGLQRHEA